MGRIGVLASRDREVFDSCINLSQGVWKWVVSLALNMFFTGQLPVTQKRKGLAELRSISSQRQVSFIASQDDAVMSEVTQSIYGWDWVSKTNIS